MKKCPFCDAWNIDEVIQCRHCHEWLDLESTPRNKTSVKSSKKEQSKTNSVKWQTKLEKIWQEYKVLPIIAIIVLVVVMLFTTSKKTDVKKDAEQIKQTESPTVEASAAPATKPASVPTSVIELYNNAESLCSSGKCSDPQKVIEYLNEAIHLQPDFAAAYGIRGNAYNDQKKYQLALEDYNEAIRMKPSIAVFFNNRGNVYKEMNQYQLAIDDYNEAIRLKPDNGESYHNRGNVYFIQGNKEIGCHDAQKACEYGKCKLLESAKNKKDCP